MPENNKFNFKEQLAWSNKQESLFLDIYKKLKKIKLMKAEDRRWDFETSKGIKIELKTDTYDADKTQNFFMERYSDLYKKTPGGLWRSVQDDVDVWLYWFPKNKVFYEFQDLPKCIKVLDKIVEEQYIVRVLNQGWTTGGYKVPRDLLHKFWKKYEYK